MWVDHMVDHFSTYIYQKRGFYYFSRRMPKDVQPLHGKQRIVLTVISTGKVGIEMPHRNLLVMERTY